MQQSAQRHQHQQASQWTKSQEEEEEEEDEHDDEAVHAASVVRVSTAELSSLFECLCTGFVVWMSNQGES